MTHDPEPDASHDGEAEPHEHCDHDHGVSYGPALDEDAAREQADPGKMARWRLLILLGAVALMVGWVLWPTLHVLNVERPLRYISGSVWTFGFAVHVGVATWLLTARPPWVAYPAHRVGMWVLRVLAVLGVALAALGTWIGDNPLAIGVIGWLEYPVVITWLGMGFAYLGRLLRLELDGRFANLADLAGVGLVLLWIGSQLVSGYPGLALIIPSVVAMALAELVLAVLALRYLAMLRA